MTWVSDRKNASGGEELFCAKQEDVDLPHKCSYSWMFLWQWPVPNQSSQFAYSSKKMNRANWNLDHLSFSPGCRHVHGNISRAVKVWKWLSWLHNSNYQYYYYNENALLKKQSKGQILIVSHQNGCNFKDMYWWHSKQLHFPLCELSCEL